MIIVAAKYLFLHVVDVLKTIVSSAKRDLCASVYKCLYVHNEQKYFNACNMQLPMYICVFSYCIITILNTSTWLLHSFHIYRCTRQISLKQSPLLLYQLQHNTSTNHSLRSYIVPLFPIQSSPLIAILSDEPHHQPANKQLVIMMKHQQLVRQKP